MLRMMTQSNVRFLIPVFQYSFFLMMIFIQCIMFFIHLIIAWYTYIQQVYINCKKCCFYSYLIRFDDGLFCSVVLIQYSIILQFVKEDFSLRKKIYFFCSSTILFNVSWCFSIESMILFFIISFILLCYDLLPHFRQFIH